MLQQTQVDRVLPKYHEWLSKYPTLSSLAEAPEAEVVDHLAAPRLQHPAEAPAVDRARGGRALRRVAALRRADAAVVQGARPLHGRRHPELRVSPARGDSRHQRRAGAVPRLCRQGDPKAHATIATCGRSRGAGPAQARLRLQPGADGFRRDTVHGAQAAVSAVSICERLRVLPVDGGHESRKAPVGNSEATGHSKVTNGTKALTWTWTPLSFPPP